MGEAATNLKPKTLAEMIEKISTSGTMTIEDQREINERAKHSVDNVDFVAIKTLTDLIRAGTVKVV